MPIPDGYNVEPTNQPIGSDDANNEFASTNVVANADGSVLERLETIQQKVGAVDATDNILGANDADNGFSSAAVVANADGSIIERLEAIKDQVTTVDDFVDTEVAAIKTETDKIPAEVIKTAAIAAQVARTCAKKTAATPVTQDLFTVTGGAVRILAIVGHITTEIAAGANNAKLVFTSAGGAAVDLCSAADIAGMAIRKLLTITGIAADAIALSAAEGVVVSAVATAPIIVTPGVLSLNCTAGTTGVIDWYIEYEPLASGATIA